MSSTQNAYWHSVQESMVTFHGIGRDAAKASIQRYRLALLKTGDPFVLEFATHEEAFYLAAELAGREVLEPTPDQAKVYAKILERCTAEAAAFGSPDELASLTRVIQRRVVPTQSKPIRKVFIGQKKLAPLRQRRTVSA